MAINRDQEIRCRINILITEVKDPDNPVGRGGRQGKTERKIIDIPVVIMDNNEFISRATDIADAITYGYELTGTQPPEAVTEGTIGVTTVVATLRGRILPNVNTSCGFLYGTTKELDNTTDADESAIAAASDTPVAIQATVMALTPNTRYYYRAWAQLAGLRVRYGRIRSFVTDAV